MQELTAKIKALEIQLRTRPPSSLSHDPHPISDRDRSHSLSISSTRLLSKPHDSTRLSTNNPYPIPLSSPSSPTPTSAIGIPSLSVYAEENAMETKKRELEITKEFNSREASSPRDTVSPRDSMLNFI